MKFLGTLKNTDNLMLSNVLYQRGKDDNNKTVDYINIIYKDLDTGEKKLKTIKSPEIDIFFTKEEYRDYDYNKTHIELSKVDKHTVPYNSMTRYIANQAGKEYMDFIKDAIARHDYKSLSKIHYYPYVFGSDISIEAWYRMQWLIHYDNERTKPLSKMFMDIEVDTITIPGFPQGGECPINGVTIVDEESMTDYVFLLHNHANPLIQEFVDDIDNFVESLHDAFDESYGRLTYNIYMYDSEKEMIKDVFRLINSLKRDFVLIWNGGGFDVPYIIDRINVLGMSPEDIMCHTDFPIKTCQFHKDIRNYDIANKGDYLKLSSYSKFIDQMVLYAATRKGQGELRSNALNYIAEKELDDKKLDYNDVANIKTLPYQNYIMFVMYMIKDGLLGYGIENKAHDVDGLYLRSYSNSTDYDKVFRQTVTLKCRAYYEYLLQGNILGNNVNANFTDTNERKVTFGGAVVGDPLLNSHTGIDVFGYKSKFIYKNAVDMDFSAMYPHIIIAFNIERNTMIGKLLLEGFDSDRYEHLFIKEEMVSRADYEEYDDEDDDEDEDKNAILLYDAGADFMDNLLTGDTLSIGTKWFNLPEFKTINDRFKKKFGIKETERIDILKGDTYFLEKLMIDIPVSEVQ